MKPPAFWFRPQEAPGLAPRLMTPLSLIYAKITARRLRQSGYSPAVPVICVGNINIGGTGKTPTTIALTQWLEDQGRVPHIVSRGYGGSLTGPVQVVDHSARETGDEPLLLSAFAPTWVARDRAAGVRAAEAAGADIILLDDGFQNPSVSKSLSFVVVDARVGFGNGRVLPAGPLREPVLTGLMRADALIVIGGEEDQSLFLRRWGGTIGDFPIVRAQLKPLETGMPWHALKLYAFAGIGRPEKFFQTLRDMGADLAGTSALDDHQPLTESILARLTREAAAAKAQLVTTEKDAVRLPAAYRNKVLTLPVRLDVQDKEVLERLLKPILKRP